MSDRRLTYTFGPLERRGILGPIRAGQAALVATGGLMAIVALDATPSAAGALVAAILVATGAHRGIRATRGAQRRGVDPGRGRVRPATDRRPGARHVGGGRRRHLARRGGLGSTRWRAGRGATTVGAGRTDRCRRVPRPRDRRPVRAFRPPPDGGARVPGDGVLAAGRRCSGAPAGAVGPGTQRRRRNRDPPDAVAGADRAGPGRRARSLGARRTRSRGAAPRDADDRVLSGAHLLQRPGEPGARDPAGDPGRRPAVARPGQDGAAPGAAGADRAGRPGAPGGRGHGPGRAQPGTARPDAAHGI